MLIELYGKKASIYIQCEEQTQIDYDTNYQKKLENHNELEQTYSQGQQREKIRLNPWYNVGRHLKTKPRPGLERSATTFVRGGQSSQT